MVAFSEPRWLNARGMETLTSQYLALSKCPDGIVEVQCDPCNLDFDIGFAWYVSSTLALPKGSEGIMMFEGEKRILFRSV